MSSLPEPTEGEGKEEEEEKEGKPQAARMTSENTGITIEDAPTFQIVCLAAFWVPGGNDKWQ